MDIPTRVTPEWTPDGRFHSSPDGGFTVREIGPDGRAHTYMPENGGRSLFSTPAADHPPTEAMIADTPVTVVFSDASTAG